MSKKVKTSEAKNYESKKLRNVPDDENSMGKPFFKSLYSLWLISIVIFLYLY